jgi:hypothetical protein
MQGCVRRLEYVMTLHAEEEMNDDDFTIYDVERCILNGTILERQADARSGQWKHRIAGRSVDGRAMEIVARLGPTDSLIIITVYEL